ncbi:MAG: hypothetical protein LWY06_04980, partial [Firmicutes bacterium]|nr:hypothetical protein [Bacillota bacterium]
MYESYAIRDWNNHNLTYWFTGWQNQSEGNNVDFAYKRQDGVAKTDKMNHKSNCNLKPQDEFASFGKEEQTGNKSKTEEDCYPPQIVNEQNISTQ